MSAGNAAYGERQRVRLVWDTAVRESLGPPTDASSIRGDHAAGEIKSKPTGINLEEETMKKNIILCGVMALGVACAPLVMADEGSTESHHYVKDSAITTKVKAKLAAKHLSTLTRIKVDTDADGVVWLSGRAPTKDAADLAAMIAQNTEGVNAVHNDIVVEP
jgi:hyperosmotically inducible protein